MNDINNALMISLSISTVPNIDDLIKRLLAVEEPDLPAGYNTEDHASEK